MEQGAATSSRTPGSVTLISDAAPMQSVVEHAQAAPHAVAPDRAVAQHRTTGVTGDRCVGAAKAFMGRQEALVKPDGVEGKRFQ